ncbi:MAG: hypothetical protein BGO30_01825 [Bacteroidetes bacterium 41-46]|nr:MAG: hypothetical protein BGO30_01825 [Bacteroidetes bacterium 41-46]
MEGFITFIFISALAIFILSRVLPYLLAWWVRRRLSKMSGGRNPYGEDFGTRSNKVREEGETIVSDDVKRDKIVDSDVGEYVDFEESKK